MANAQTLAAIAANLNCLGAALLEIGDRFGARASFGQSLGMITQATDLTPVGQQVEVQANLFLPPQFYPPERHPALQVTRRIGARAPSLPPEGGPFLYNQPLVFGPKILLSRANLPFYSAIVTFNVALTFHVKPSNTIDELSLRLASSLYNLALCVLLDGQNAPLGASLPFAALLNNKAEAHFELGEYETCKLILEGLWALLFNQQIWPPLEGPELDGFFYNILCLLNSPLHAPTA
ncbi:expressed unknown protein [Seminavis robusta]|uniref:Uncharacterized protein n=1 Tax=Seminavis robusta TaxID=568900 RepID=A0A9N8HIT2_9STRA|nr:expressed unknown protein [Seminavis robusta]|eukprot:Sro719_g192290.1 n/a (236) ;mRNA; f:8825-9532